MRRTFATLFLALAGCAELFNKLRTNIDDPSPDPTPTTGGVWSERRFLYDDVPGAPYPGSLGASGNSGAQTQGQPQREIASTSETNSSLPLSPGGSSGFGGPIGTNVDNYPNLEPSIRRVYRSGGRSSRQDFVDNSQNEGSLWGSSGQTNYYFTKNKIRSFGDIVNIPLDEQLIKDFATEVKRSLTLEERKLEVHLLEEKWKGLAQAKSGEDPNRRTDPTAQPAAAGFLSSTAGVATQQAASGASASTDFSREPTISDVDLTGALGLKAGDPFLVEIVERYPNGNYKVRGTRKVPYKNGTQRWMYLIAVVKSTDLGDDDNINAGKLYEYRLEAVR